MSNINVQWDNIHRSVIRFTFRNHWTWRECETALLKGMVLLDSVNHPVDIIYDMSESLLPPQKAMTHTEKLISLTRHAHLRRLVIVEHGSILRMYLEIVGQTTPGLVHNYDIGFARDITRARNLLYTPV